MGEGSSAPDWAALVPRLIHETKVWIIEAMSRLERPVSAREMQAISGGKQGISAFDYHLRSLRKAGCVRVVLSQRVRGAREYHYFFTDAVMRSRQGLPGSGA